LFGPLKKKKKPSRDILKKGQSAKGGSIEEKREGGPS